MDRQSYKNLLAGNTSSLRDWLTEYADWLWSWLCLHTDNPQSAGEALIKTFSGAAQRLSEFPSSGASMSEWLRSLAQKSASISAGVLKANDEEYQTLCRTLTSLSNEPLSAQRLTDRRLNDLVKSAMMELDKDEMELLSGRYSRLDTVRRLADRMGISVERLQGRLYKARHSFKRTLQTMAGIADIDEPAAGMQAVEILEANLEKLLCSVWPVSPVPPEIYDRLEEVVGRSFEQVQKMHMSGPSGKRRILAVCAAMAAAAVFAIWFLWPAGGGGKTEHSPIRPETVRPEKPGNAAAPAGQAQDVAMELKQTLAAGEAGDIDGLMKIMRTGGLAGQLIAARYLAEYGDRPAIEALQAAAVKWGGELADENPFLKAIEEIEKRLADRSAAGPVKPDVPPAAAAAVQEKPGIAIKGRITDKDGNGISGAKIGVSFRSIDDYSSVQTQKLQAGDNGVFEMKMEPASGLVRVELTDRPSDAPALVRTFLVGADIPQVQVDLGAGLSVDGTATLNGEPLIDAELFAGEVSGPDRSGFLAGCRTDGQGRFRFVGLPPGRYWVYYPRNWAGDNVSIVLGRIWPGQTNELNVRTADAAVEVFTGGGKFVPPPDDKVLTLRTAAGFLGHPVSTARTEPNEPFWFEDIPCRSYEVRIPMGGGVYWYEPIEATGNAAVQHFGADLPVSCGFADITGVPRAAGVGCFWSKDRRVRGVLESAEGKGHLLALPAGLYYAGFLFSDEPVALADFEVIDGGDVTVDLSRRQPEYAQRGLLAVYVTDAGCNLLSGAALQLRGREFIEADSNAGGICFSAWPGSYILQADMEGFVSYRGPVEISSSGATQVIRLQRP